MIDYGQNLKHIPTNLNAGSRPLNPLVSLPGDPQTPGWHRSLVQWDLALVGQLFSPECKSLEVSWPCFSA